LAPWSDEENVEVAKKQPTLERWLKPEAQQKDGSLWPVPGPDRAKRVPKIHDLPAMGSRRVTHRYVAPSDPFTAEERMFLRRKLSEAEHQEAGLSGGFTNAPRDRGDRRRATFEPNPEVQTMVDRGLSYFEKTASGSRWFLTDEGVAALRLFFKYQTLNFRTLFPRLYRDLDLESLLKIKARR
jgi:hypothetical protein